MPEVRIPPAALALAERIAGAIRRLLNADIDAYPGARTPEAADPINRVFRAVVVELLAAEAVTATALATTTSRVLLDVATRRLAAEGHDAHAIKSLIEGEPGHPDDWLAFLILSAPEQINPLLDSDAANPA